MSNLTEQQARMFEQGKNDVLSHYGYSQAENYIEKSANYPDDLINLYEQGKEEGMAMVKAASDDIANRIVAQAQNDVFNKAGLISAVTLVEKQASWITDDHAELYAKAYEEAVNALTGKAQQKQASVSPATAYVDSIRDSINMVNMVKFANEFEEWAEKNK